MGLTSHTYTYTHACKHERADQCVSCVSVSLQREEKPIFDRKKIAFCDETNM